MMYTLILASMSLMWMRHMLLMLITYSLFILISPIFISISKRSKICSSCGTNMTLLPLLLSAEPLNLTAAMIGSLMTGLAISNILTTCNYKLRNLPSPRALPPWRARYANFLNDFEDMTFFIGPLTQTITISSSYYTWAAQNGRC